MIMIEKPWGTVDIVQSDCNIPPDKIGQKGNLYLNTMACWVRMDGVEWRRATYRSAFQIRNAALNSGSMEEFLSKVEFHS